MNPGYNGHEWISHFQCTTTAYNLVYTLRNKSEEEILDSFDQALNHIEVQLGKKVRFLRIDGERSLGNRFDDYMLQKKIKLEVTAPDTPAQNGGAERAGRTIVTKARSMRNAAQLPANLWPEVVKAAGYVSNRTPTKKIAWKTPFEAVRGQLPRRSHMHIYGCKAYALKQIRERPKKAKLDPRAHIGYLVGYDSTNIFRIWTPSIAKVIRCRNIIFDDNSSYDPYDIVEL